MKNFYVVIDKKMKTTETCNQKIKHYPTLFFIFLLFYKFVRLGNNWLFPLSCSSANALSSAVILSCCHALSFDKIEICL